MRGERPFVYHTPNGREMFQPLQKILPALRTGAVNRSVGDGVLQWSAAEQMPLGYAVPSVGADDSARPRPAHPVGRGPRAPPERMCLLRRDTWVPPCKSFRRGRCPHRPARIALPANALGVDVPQKKEAPLRVLPLHILNASAACRSACSAMCPGSGTAAPAGSE